MEQTIHMIGNAHIDPVWLWRWQEGLAEIKATYRAALDRMDEFPEFVFTSACAAYFDWIERSAPEMFEELRKRIAEGRLVLVGGFWVQPDCNIPSGESFCRHALYSQRYFQEKFGRIATAGYNVDSFGHNGMLPQILVKSGMDNYVFMRPDEREKDIPASLFRWRSPDGSTVRAFRIPISYGEWTRHLDMRDYPGLHVAVVKILETQGLSQRENLPMMCFYGVGNHGGGPTIKALKAITAYKDENRGAVCFSSPDAYFSAAPADGLMTITDDLQHHASGCYAANSAVKALNRRAENRLLTAEKLMACAHMLMEHPYDKALLERAWRKLLFNQFHDILAGCCVKEAYEDATEAFGETLNIAAELANGALQKISWNVDTSGGMAPVLSKESDWVLWEREDRGVPVVIFNPHSFAVEASIRINKEIAGATDHEGRPVPVQRVRGGQTNAGDLYNALFPAQLPPLGYAVYWIFKTRTFERVRDGGEVFAGENALENSRIRVEFSPETGEISSILDKARGEALLAGPCRASVVDESDSDTWAHNIFEFSREIGQFGNPTFHITENGPLRAALRVEQQFEDTLIRRDYSLLAGRAQLDVCVRMDVRLRHRQIKFCFPLTGEGDRPVYSMPYGFIEKQPDGLEEPAQQWVAVGKGGAPRFALLNDAKYSFSMKGQTLRMTAVRTPAFADHYGERDGLMEYMDQGVSEFRYALLIHPESMDGIVRAARLLNQPPEMIVETYHKGRLPLRQSGMEIAGGRVIAEVLKRAEADDGYILRLFDASGQGAKDVLVRCAGREARLDFKPQEIKTVFLPDCESMPVRETMIPEMD